MKKYFLCVLFFSNIIVLSFFRLSSFELQRNFGYNAIKMLLDKYERPFTIVDIGVEDGSYLLNLAHEYRDSVCVMIQDDVYSTELLHVCKNHKHLRNVILLKKSIVLNDLTRLSECEHFDAILLFNFLKRFGNIWKPVLSSVFNMGDNIIIEINYNDALSIGSGEIESYLALHGATLVESNKDSGLYMIKKKNVAIERVNWLFPKITNKKSLVLQSGFKKKELIKTRSWEKKISEWIPGINLVTFKMYHGVYPNKCVIKNSIKKHKNLGHRDWTPANMIIQGDHVALIDFDETGGTPYSAKMLHKILNFIDIDDPLASSKFYYEHILKRDYLKFKASYQTTH